MLSFYQRLSCSDFAYTLRRVIIKNNPFFCGKKCILYNFIIYFIQKNTHYHTLKLN